MYIPAIIASDARPDPCPLGVWWWWQPTTQCLRKMYRAWWINNFAFARNDSDPRLWLVTECFREPGQPDHWQQYSAVMDDYGYLQPVPPTPQAITAALAAFAP